MIRVRLGRYNLIMVLVVLMLSQGQIAPKAQATHTPAFSLSLSDGTPVELSFSATPEVSGCQQVETGEYGQLWRCSDYSLLLRIDRTPDADLISFELENPDGLPFNLHETGIRLVVPGAGGDALWTFNRMAGNNIMETNLARPWEFFSAANTGIPYLALVDREGLTKLALGLLGQDHAVITKGESLGGGDDYALSLRQADNETAESFSGTYYISRAQDLWFRNAQRYTEIVGRASGFIPNDVPEAALNPTYDSWYWTLDNISQALVWDLAMRSSALGFKTYLLDAGWDARAGEYAKGLGGSTGDYMPPRGTFPDFPALLNNIRERLGMKVMFWMQQYNLGRRSVYYPEFGSALCQVGDPWSSEQVLTQFLCPNTYATRRHMADLFSRILDTYRPDALWFDLQESIPQVCSAPHIHEFDRFGDGYNAAQQTIMDIIRQRSPDIFIDMRWPFANLNNKPYTHLWQPSDSPGDFEGMRLRAMVMRPFSAGVVMGTDEMYWAPEISDSEAARFMAATVFTGVPYFGPNLPAERPARTEILRAWIRFYETNKEDLVYGEFSPYGDRDHPDQLIEGKQATFIYYGNRYPGPVPLAQANGRIYVVNASESSGIDLDVVGLKVGWYRAEISDSRLRNRRHASTLMLESTSRLRFDLPVGCLLTLTYLD